MLCIDNLGIELPGFKLNNISFNISEGEYFVMLGPSGSGKTIFLESLAGKYNNAEGTITYKGVKINSLPIENRGIGFVYQNYELFPFLTVEENIGFGLKIRGYNKVTAKKEIEKYLNIFNINHLRGRYPNTLSGGESQRVAIARALIIKPNILLLDEPLSALDKLTRDRLIKEFKSINKRFNVTIIHITHDINEALFLGDRIGIMKYGSIDKIITRKELSDIIKDNKLYSLFNREE